MKIKVVLFENMLINKKNLMDARELAWFNKRKA